MDHGSAPELLANVPLNVRFQGHGVDEVVVLEAARQGGERRADLLEAVGRSSLDGAVGGLRPRRADGLVAPIASTISGAMGAAIASWQDLPHSAGDSPGETCAGLVSPLAQFHFVAEQRRLLSCRRSCAAGHTASTSTRLMALSQHTSMSNETTIQRNSGLRRYAWTTAAASVAWKSAAFAL